MKPLILIVLVVIVVVAIGIIYHFQRQAEKPTFTSPSCIHEGGMITRTTEGLSGECCSGLKQVPLQAAEGYLPSGNDFTCERENASA